MIKLQTKITNIKWSNLVYLLEKKSDLKLLDFLNLDKKIIEKIEKTIKENKNSCLDFFLWDKNFDKLTVLFYDNKKEKSLIYFLWEHFPKLDNKLTILSNEEDNLLKIVDTCLLSRHKMQTYKTEKKQDNINIIIDKDNKKIVESRLETINNIILARDLWETPANDLTPEDFVKIVKATKFKNTKVKILTPKDIQKKGLNLLWAVWKWSVNKPYMVILERIVNKKAPTYGFIWKGIVFDTWGIQVKPDNYMYEMKWDMCWAANAFATMKELDNKDLNVNIIACLTLAENHISGESFKPSDIFTSYSGKTVDIGHTDAEWRLVLADGVSYISKNYKTDSIITIATLTWAVVAALGYRHAGVMGTDRKIIDSLVAQSKTNFEMYSELPFDDYFVEKTKSEIADLSNIDRGIKAGSTMWAAFLYNFRMNNEKYTHIDIAWTAMNDYEAYGYNPKGMTGFWVDSLSAMFLELK